MSYEEPIVLKGNKVRHLMNILNLKKATELNYIVVHRNPFQCYSYNGKGFKFENEYRITKKDIQQIKLMYEITGDLETSLLYLFKD